MQYYIEMAVLVLGLLTFVVLAIAVGWKDGEWYGRQE